MVDSDNMPQLVDIIFQNTSTLPSKGASYALPMMSGNLQERNIPETVLDYDSHEKNIFR